ncbi:MAG: hypothetical protein J1E98_07970 [Lachnospiraceae bacterium]|nr:hypothetical protein [Lachnospiraceae bacterium]
MRKVSYTLLFLLLFLMCGCSAPIVTSYEDNNVQTLKEDNNVETLKSWSFQFNKGTNDYSLFFGLLNKNNEYISADVDVDIRIVNEKDEEVYKGTKSIFKSDFDYYTNQIAGEQYLAELRIPASDIISGKSSNGTVYLTVYKNDTVRFDEVNCSALYCLPISDVELIFDTFPLSIDVKGYDGSIESTIQIDDITYLFEKDFIPQVKIIVSGVKIYGKPDSISSYDMIRYKLYDSEEYMITSGNIYLHSLDQGDKFKDDSIVIYDITPGETYKLILCEYD